MAARFGALALAKQRTATKIDARRAAHARDNFLQAEAALGPGVVGDDSLNSMKSFEKRQKIRREPSVRHILDDWWDTAMMLAVQNGRSAPTDLHWQDYKII